MSEKNNAAQNKNTHDIPNHVFDMEYSTQRRKEYLFLKDNGIIPSYVKENKQYNVRTYKYTKTPELFEKVAEFYRGEQSPKTEQKKPTSLTQFLTSLLGGGVKVPNAKIIV